MNTRKSKLGRTAPPQSRNGGRRWLWVALAAWGFHGGAGLLTACGEVNEGGGSDSNTHWLEPCDRDADCGDLVCLCGQCTQPCEDNRACGDLPGASCARSSACSGASEPASCVAECSLDADCGALREGLQCVEDQCVPIAGPGSGGSGGTDGVPSSGGSGGSLAGNPSVAGSGGTSGGTSGGAPAEAGAGGGSAGAGPTGECAPMDALATGLDLPCLPGAPVYSWNGDYCQAFSACGCLGEDCDELYPTLAECDASYQACYESQGITGACEQDADCRLTYRGCCEPCADVVGFEGLAATSESEEPNWHLCQQVADCAQCADPPYEPTQEAEAACVENRCILISRCEGLDAEQCSERSICNPLYGRAPGGDEESYLGCKFDPQADANASSQCELADLCITADGGSCLLLGAHCVGQRPPQGFRPISCEDPACSP